MKNKKVIIIASILAVIVLISSYIIFNNSFAIPEQNSASLSCDKTTLSIGGSTTCYLNGSSSGVVSTEGHYSVSGGLSISNVGSTDSWAISSVDNGFFTLAANQVKRQFNMLRFTITAKSGVEGSTQNVNITGIKYTDTAGEAELGNKSVNINVVSNNNNLSSLKVSGTTFNFNPSTTTYNLTVNNSSTTISATAQSNKATVTGTGLKSLKYGKNTFKVYVKSQAGQTKTYTLNITRPDNRSSNNYLSSLKISSGSLSFSKTKTSYNVTVGTNVNSVKVSASLADSKASFAKGYNPRTVKLGYGKTAIAIKVIAQNGATRTYTINVTRPKSGSGSKTSTKASTKSNTKTEKKSSDNKLKTLYLSDGSIDFKSDKYSYDVEVSNSVKTITIKGDPSSDKAKVKGLGEHSLKVGGNTIDIVVTAENGDEKTYVLRITRKSKDESSNLSDNNYLKDLSIAGYEIDFDKETLNYDINRNNNKTLDIKARTESKKAQVVIMGNEDLKDKDEVKVVVTAENGENRTYTIAVHDSGNLMYTAIGIFVIGFLALLVAFAYKRKKNSADEIIAE